VEGLLAVTVVWVSTKGVQVEPPAEETYYVELTTEVSIPEPPPPPEAPTLVPATAPAPLEVKGFQELAMPTTTLAEIPPPVLGSLTINARDFTGEGRPGGFGGVEAVAEERPLDSGPTFTPYTVAPWLKNTQVVSRALQREYPTTLRSAGIGAQVLIWLFIDETGRVQQTVLKTSSGFESVDAAAMRVAMLMEFTPALNRDRHVPVWVAVPVDFKVS
jgi:protein TonB